MLTGVQAASAILGSVAVVATVIPLAHGISFPKALFLTDKESRGNFQYANLTYCYPPLRFIRRKRKIARKTHSISGTWGTTGDFFWMDNGKTVPPLLESQCCALWSAPEGRPQETEAQRRKREATEQYLLGRSE